MIIHSSKKRRCIFFRISNWISRPLKFYYYFCWFLPLFAGRFEFILIIIMMHFNYFWWFFRITLHLEFVFQNASDAVWLLKMNASDAFWLRFASFAVFKIISAFRIHYILFASVAVFKTISAVRIHYKLIIKMNLKCIWISFGGFSE